MSARAELVLTGTVQGVFLRTSSQAKARELRLTGWAHNEPDGSVTMVVEGERSSIEEFIAWVRKGSDLASVDDVVVEWGDAVGVFNDFEI